MTLTTKEKTPFETSQTQTVFKNDDINKITKQIHETINILTCFKCDFVEESQKDLFEIVVGLEWFLEQINE